MASRKINIDIDRQSMYAVMKQDQIAEFMKNEENPNISEEYKESARRLLLQDIAGINGMLGLEPQDGVREWLESREFRSGKKLSQASDSKTMR